MDPAPPGLPELARLLIAGGALAVVAGVVLLVVSRLPWLGQLPGDLTIHRDHVTIYFPIVTSIVVSIVATIVLNLFFRR